MNDDIQEAFERTRTAGIIAAGALDEVTKIIKPGITTKQIDNLCYEFINDNGACSAPLFYRGFPKSCCTSVNHTICHGIPSDKTLNDGDIINVDVTAFKNGWHGDTSRMFYAGDVSVIPTVCSNCADNFLSFVTAVHPSFNILVSSLPSLIIGSIVNIMPGLSLGPYPFLP